MEDVLEPLAWIRARRDGLIEKWKRGTVPVARDDGVDVRGRPVAEAHGPAVAGRDIALGNDVTGPDAGQDLRTLVEERPIVGCVRPPGLLAVSVESKRPFQVFGHEGRIAVRWRQPQADARRDVIQHLPPGAWKPGQMIDHLRHVPHAIRDAEIDSRRDLARRTRDVARALTASPHDHRLAGPLTRDILDGSAVQQGARIAAKPVVTAVV